MDSSGPPTWLTQEKKFLPKKFLIFQKKKYFLTKKFFAPVWKNKSPVPPNFFLYLPETNLFFPKKSFSHPTRKNNFPPKIFFINYQKKQFSTKNFLYLHIKFKALHFRCALSTAKLFLMPANIVFCSIRS